jgi:ankyrin repeat protein
MWKRQKYLIIAAGIFFCLMFILYCLGFRYSLPDKTIQSATKHRNLPKLKDFISKAQNIDIRDKSGKTALQIACADIFNREIAELLIQSGANVNQVSVNGVPLITEVLCSKIYMEKEKMLDLLVKHNADINKKDTLGNTPLISASEEIINPKTVEHFMQYKPEVNILNNKGESALFIAVVNGNGSYAKILSENEANPNLIGTDRNSMVLFDRNDHSFCTTGKSLLDIAITQGAYDVVSVLKKYGAKTSEELKK